MILAAISLLIPPSTLMVFEVEGIVIRVYRPKTALERNLPMLVEDRRDLSSTILMEEEERTATTIFATMK